MPIYVTDDIVGSEGHRSQIRKKEDMQEALTFCHSAMSFALRTLADGRASLLRLLQNKMGVKTQIPSESMLGCPPEIWQLLS